MVEWRPEVAIPKAVSRRHTVRLILWRVIVGGERRTSARTRAGAAQGTRREEDWDTQHGGRTCQGLDKDLHGGSARAPTCAVESGPHGGGGRAGGSWGARWARAHAPSSFRRSLTTLYTTAVQIDFGVRSLSSTHPPWKKAPGAFGTSAVTVRRVCGPSFRATSPAPPRGSLLAPLPPSFLLHAFAPSPTRSRRDVVDHAVQRSCGDRDGGQGLHRDR